MPLEAQDKIKASPATDTSEPQGFLFEPWMETFTPSKAQKALGGDVSKLAGAFLFLDANHGRDFWWGQVATGQLSPEGRAELERMLEAYSKLHSPSDAESV